MATGKPGEAFEAYNQEGAVEGLLGKDWHRQHDPAPALPAFPPADISMAQLLLFMQQQQQAQKTLMQQQRRADRAFPRRAGDQSRDEEDEGEEADKLENNSRAVLKYMVTGKSNSNSILNMAPCGWLSSTDIEPP